MSGSVSSPLKWHGGKHYLAARIVDLMPAHLHYVEPFAGGLSVLLAKDPGGVSEVVNDLDGQLMNFWKTLATPLTFEWLLHSVRMLPFSEEIFEDARLRLERPCQRTRDQVCSSCGLAFFVVCRQSLAGRMESFAPLTRRRTRRGMNEQASAWLSAVDGLPEVHARLRRVVVLNRPALDVIRQQDGEATLFCCDPPYLQTTRTAPEVYRHEMSESDHFDLLDTLKHCVGRVLLSGYRSKMYDEVLTEAAGWRRVDFEMANNAAGGETKRRVVESVWCNFSPVVAEECK